MQPVQITTDQIPTTVIKATRSVLILRLLAAVLAGLVAIVGWRLNIWALPVFLGLSAIGGIASVGQAAIGAIYVSPAGIRFRRGTRMEAIRWADVHQFVEVSRPWGRYLVVEKSVPYAMPIRYAMPSPKTSLIFLDPGYDRDIARLRAWAGMLNPQATAPTRLGFGTPTVARIGLLVLLLAATPFDRPYGWFGGPQASTVPVACAALSDTLATRIGATNPDAGTNAPTTSVCDWSVPSGTLRISYHLFTRKGLHSGSDRAAEDQTFERLDRFHNGFAILDKYSSGAQDRLTAPGWALASDSALVMLTTAGNVEVTVEMGYSTIDDATLAALSTATNAAIAAVKRT